MLKGKYSFKIRTYECDATGFATMPSICNYLQEAASIHAGELGFSKSDFNNSGENISWVLTRLIVDMQSYPKWGDEVTIETFPRGGRRIAAWRDFEIKDATGNVIGKATSEWMIIDLAARRTIAIPQNILSCIDDSVPPVMGANPFSKLRLIEECNDPAFSTKAQKSHIDLNGHVNNVRYIEWMLEPCQSPRPKRMEIVFRGEAFAGDEVNVSVISADDGLLLRVFSLEGKDYIIAKTTF